MVDVAPSTVAMTAYNALSVAMAPQSAPKLQTLARKLQAHPGQIGILQDGLELLVERRLIVKKGDEYDLIDPLRRPVVARDRTDPEGWKGWLVRDASGKQLPLEEIVG